jgi:Arc/MetJ-type ribon-helix-helix transcriptional regulator
MDNLVKTMVTDPQAAAIDAEARATNKSRSEVLRKALDEHLESDGITEARADRIRATVVAVVDALAPIIQQQVAKALEADAVQKSAAAGAQIDSAAGIARRLERVEAAVLGEPA